MLFNYIVVQPKLNIVIMNDSALSPSDESYLIGDRKKITKFIESHGIPKPMGYLLRILFEESTEIWEKSRRKTWKSVFPTNKTSEIILKHYVHRSKDYHLALLNNDDERCNQLKKEVEEIAQSYLSQKN